MAIYSVPIFNLYPPMYQQCTRAPSGTMPIFNLFKNCSYYWGFTAYLAYHVNHPLFTAPSDVQMYAGLAAFMVRSQAFLVGWRCGLAAFMGSQAFLVGVEVWPG